MVFGKNIVGLVLLGIRGFGENLLEDLPGDSLFGKVVRLLLAEPEMDTPTLLAALSGEAHHGLLVDLAQKPSVLDEKSLLVEFLEGVEKLMLSSGDAHRKLLIQEMKKDGTSEGLAAYWALKQNRSRKIED